MRYTTYMMNLWVNAHEQCHLAAAKLLGVRAEMGKQETVISDDTIRLQDIVIGLAPTLPGLLLLSLFAWGLWAIAETPLANSFFATGISLSLLWLYGCRGDWFLLLHSD